MSGSPAGSWKRARRWLGVGIAAAAVAIAGVVISTSNGSRKKSLPVLVVLAHATIHTNSPDAVFVVNRSSHRMDWQGCVPMVSPRTSSSFRWPPDTGVCLLGHPIAPHAVRRIEATIATTWPPGNYWVWFPYSQEGKSASGPSGIAYTKLTILPS
jgi:hypothetical protein